VQPGGIPQLPRWEHNTARTDSRARNPGVRATQIGEVTLGKLSDYTGPGKDCREAPRRRASRAARQAPAPAQGTAPERNPDRRP